MERRRFTHAGGNLYYFKSGTEDRDRVNEQEALDAMFYDATELWDEGRKNEAAQLYRQILKISRSHSFSLLNLGALCLERGQYRRAEILFRHTIRVAPEYAEAHYNLGWVLDEIGDHNNAEVAYLAAISIDSSHVGAHANLASFYEQRGRYLHAIKYYRRFLHLAPRGEFARTARKNLAVLLKSCVLKGASNKKAG